MLIKKGPNWAFFVDCQETKSELLVLHKGIETGFRKTEP
jgi:hypothetical protein